VGERRRHPAEIRHLLTPGSKPGSLASIPNGIWAENMGLLDDLWVDPPEIADGFITAPERPGHGLAFKEEVRREFRLFT
jgi:L-alanine-DL-glutamate epimerase-like enolase superfamily enzyme